MASRLLGGDFVCGEMTVNPRILFLLDVVYLTSTPFKRPVQARFKFIPEFILLQCRKRSLIKMCNYMFIFIAKWTIFSNKPKIFSLVTSVITCAQTFFVFSRIRRAPERTVNKSPSCYILLGRSNVLTWKPGGYSRDFLGGVPPVSPNPDPISGQKNVIFHIRFQTWPLKSIPLLRPDL